MLPSLHVWDANGTPMRLTPYFRSIPLRALVTTTHLIFLILALDYVRRRKQVVSTLTGTYLCFDV